jgi:hypothetical protein
MPAAAIGRDDAVDYVLPVTDIARMLVLLCPQAVGPDGGPVREAYSS